MPLYYIKTSKFEWLKTYAPLALLVPILMQMAFGNNIGYRLELMLFYMIMTMVFMVHLCNRGWRVPQALAVAGCLTFFGSLMWELPIMVYTAILRGGIDGAFPLHLLYIFPIVFVYEKLRTNKSKMEVLTWVAISLLASTIYLHCLLYFNVDIWFLNLNPVSTQVIVEVVWMLNRLITIGCLFKIYSLASERKKKNEKSK